VGVRVIDSVGVRVKLGVGVKVGVGVGVTSGVGVGVGHSHPPSKQAILDAPRESMQS